MDLARLGYREIAVRYDLGSVKTGGDLQVTPDGDLAMTVDGDLKIGDDQHNALHRLVVRWQFNAPMVSTMLDIVAAADAQQKANRDDMNRLATEFARDRMGTIDRFHEIQHDMGIHEYGPEACAGAVMVVLTNLLRREWVDLSKPGTWAIAGEAICGRRFGPIVESAANNFRHSDEWARTEPPDEQQMRSITVLADVLGKTLKPDGSKHPFRHNVCPEVLLALSRGSFERLMDRFFEYARALAGL